VNTASKPSWKMAAAPEQMGRCRAPAVALSPVRACRASDGATMWSVPSPLTTNLTAGPDAVYAVAVALNSRHGTRLWSCAANAMTAPLLAGGVIYVPGCDTYSNTSLMLAIRPATAPDCGRSRQARAMDGWPTTGRPSAPCPASAPTPSLRQTPARSRPRCGPRASDGQLLYRSPVSAGYCSQPAMTAGMAFALTAGNGHTLPGCTP